MNDCITVWQGVVFVLGYLSGMFVGQFLIEWIKYRRRIKMKGGDN